MRYVGIIIALLFACALYARGQEVCGADGCPVKVRLVAAFSAIPAATTAAPCACGDACKCAAPASYKPMPVANGPVTVYAPAPLRTFAARHPRLSHPLRSFACHHPQLAHPVRTVAMRHPVLTHPVKAAAVRLRCR